MPHHFFVALIFAVFILTQTRPIRENFREYRAGWIGTPCGFRCFSVLCLNCLSHEAAHSLGGFFLHLAGDVGIGVQGETRTVMAQNAGDGFGVYTLLDCKCGIGMPKLVEAENEAILVEAENGI